METNISMPPTAPSQPVKTEYSSKSTNVKVGLGRLSQIIVIIVLIVSGVAAYIWRDAQANNQKKDDDAKIKVLGDKITTLEKAAKVTAQQEVMLHSYGDLVKNVAESYNTNKGHYPILAADFISGNNTLQLPPGVAPSIIDPSPSTNGVITFRWEYTGPASAPTGGRITYWDFANNKVSDNPIYVGTATAKSVFVTPAS